MPAEDLVFRAGEIVLADWRGDALPKEPNKRRPAVIVEEATTSKARLRATPSRITADQLATVRRQIALAIGME